MTDKDRAAALFDGWEETLIWSALQGVMGRLEWNGDGSAGRITLGDFCFLAGKPDRALAETLEAPIVTAREEGWYRLVEKKGLFSKRQRQEYHNRRRTYSSSGFSGKHFVPYNNGYRK